MPAAKPKVRNTFLIGTILIVVAFFSYYFLGHIPQKEKNMRELGIRVMNRMVKNIAAKEVHYNNSIKNFECLYNLDALLATKDTGNIAYNLSYSECFLSLNSIQEKRDQFEEKVDSVDTYYFDLLKAEKTKYNQTRISEGEYYDALDGIYMSWDDALVTVFKRMRFFELLKIELSKLDKKVKYANGNDTLKGNLVYWKLLSRGKRELNVASNDFEDTTSVQVLAINADDFLNDIKKFQYFDDIILVVPTSGKVMDKSKKNIDFFDFNTLSEVQIEGEEIQEDKSNTEFSGVKIWEKKISNVPYFAYSQLVKLNNKEYLLTGLIEQDKFRAKVREVSVWVIMISIIVLVFLIQILPVVKPFLLGKKERLQGGDMIWSGISIIFGMAALALLALAVDTFSLEEIDLVDEKLEKYAQKIEQNFAEETNLALLTLEDYENGKYDGDTLWDNENRLNKIFNNQRNYVSFLGIDPKGIGSEYFSYYNKKGTDPTIYKKFNEANNINVSHRNYYRKHFTEDSTIVWKIKSPNHKNIYRPYFIESVFSMSIGEYETVISIKDTLKNRALAYVYPFKSLNKVYLEPNFTFTIIDNKGDIQYHSDQNKIGNENLIEESNENENLIAFINNGTTDQFNIDLALTDYRAHITPLKNTNWHLVTFYKIENSRLSITSTITIVFQFILAILLYLSLLHFVLKLQKGSRKSTIKKPFTYWFINPLVTQPIHYKNLTIVNAGVLLFLILIYKSNELNLYFNIVLYFAMITATILYNYIILNEQRVDEIGVFEKRKVKYTLFEFISLVLCTIWIILFFLVSSEINFSWIYLIPVFTMVGLVVWEKHFPRGVKLANIKDIGKYFYVPFYIHSVSWVLILGIVPALLFFKPVYNQQQIKRVSKNLNSELNFRINNQDWNSNKVELFAPDDNGFEPVKNSSVSSQLVELVSVYFKNEGQYLRGQEKSEKTTTELKMARDRNGSFYKYFQINFNNNTPFYNTKKLEANQIVAFSLPRVWKSNSRKWAVIFWIVIVAFLVLLYILIKKISEKFFYLKLTRTLHTATPEYFTDDVSLRKKHKIDESNILLVGIPNSGRNTYAFSCVSDPKKVLFIDFLNELTDINSELTDLNYEQSIIINNFDYRVYDFEQSKLKLAFLEKILSARNKILSTQKNVVLGKLILVSSFDIYQFIDVYKVKIKQLAADKNANNSDEIDRLKNVLDRWESALFSFTKHVVPLVHSPAKNYIDRELNFGKALEKLKPRILAYKQELEHSDLHLKESEIRDKVFESIEDMAENYYFSIWNSCALEEKFLLYDLAEDGMLNSANSKALYSLVRKGILIFRPHLSIFNESFKIFILESISDEESKQLEKEAKKQGNWKTYQYLVVFLVVVILIFLSLAEDHAIAKITSFVSLSAILFPKIIQVASTISNKGKAY